MNIEQLREHFPPSVLEMVNIIGWEATLTLIERIGGVTYRVPMGNCKRMELLISVLGKVTAERFCEVYGGAELYIPRCQHAFRVFRNHQFKADIAEQVSQGESLKFAITLTAPIYGFSERQAWRIMGQTEAPQKQQGLLFNHGDYS